MSRASFTLALHTFFFCSFTLLLATCVKKNGTPQTGISSSLCAEVEKLTGDHTRVVWSQNQKRQSADPYSSGGHQLLLGFDSRDPSSPRALVKERGNFSRPLLSCDGGTVIFTRKETRELGDGRRQMSASVHSLDWRSGAIKRLGDGYGVDVWRDPGSGSQWVVAVRDFSPTDRPVTEGRRLVRFLLNDPSRIETLWDRTPLDPDNIQLSRDGKTACAGAPWPEVARLDLSGGTCTRITKGCWPALAPDDSGRMWVFAEDHRTVYLFGRENQAAGTLDLAAAIGHAGGAIFHPRWSSHASVITFTGPYLDEKGKGTTVARGGLSAEVYLARLNNDATAITQNLRLTTNNLGDNFPDVWVAEK